MNYFLLADFLWYSGHIMTGSSIIFSSSNHYLAIYLVFIGQFITIISRPISRINNTSKIEINNETSILV